MQLYSQTNGNQLSQSIFITTKNYSRTLRSQVKRTFMFNIRIYSTSVFMSIGCEKALSTLFFSQSSHTLTWKFTSMEDERQQIIRWPLVVARCGAAPAPRDFTLRVGPTKRTSPVALLRPRPSAARVHQLMSLH